MKDSFFKELLFLFVIILSVSICKKEEPSFGQNTGEWTIPSDQVFSGGPRIDGIPSVDSPEFAKPSGIDFSRR